MHDSQLARQQKPRDDDFTAFQNSNCSLAVIRRIHQASMQVMAAGTSEGGASCGRMAS